MIPTIYGLLPKSLALKLGSGALINKYVIIPSAIKIANTTSKLIGNTTDEENKVQTELFKDFISPLTNIFDEIEDEVLKMFTDILEPIANMFSKEDEQSKPETLKDFNEPIQSTWNAIIEPEPIYIPKPEEPPSSQPSQTKSKIVRAQPSLEKLSWYMRTP